jgi:pyridoxal phosphate enzyme (YggS family)
MNEFAARISRNVAHVRRRIAEAAVRSGRQARDVTLVAVTKYVGPAEIAALVAAGCHDLGESRPQVLWKHAAELNDSTVRWHLIGHLQRNKVARTIRDAALVHSVDSERLLRAINQEAASAGLRPEVLLEVNVSGDATKHGVPPADLRALVAVAAECPHVLVRGLMTMASREGDAASARRDFEHLRAQCDEVRKTLPPGVQLDDLSMGMSGDFEQAIEAGATIVRVGSALFE